MRKLLFLSGFVIIAVLVLAACSPAQTAAPTTQPVIIQFISDPDPAAMGKVTMIFTIQDDQGNPIEGARVDVAVDHTDMSGMGMSGPATDQGDGKYAITADFSMSGNWQMTVYVRKDALDYQQDIDLKVK